MSIATELAELTLEINQRCPNQCLFCSSFARRDARSLLTVAEVHMIGRQAAELGVRKLSISGGEPLVHPHIVEIVNDLRDTCSELALYTTGQVFGGRCESVAFKEWELFRRANPTLVFNVQSTVESIHDELAGRPGAFCLSRTSLIAAREQGFHVEVHIVPNRLNIDTIESTVTDLANWGVDRISFLRLVPQGYARLNAERLLLDEDGQLKLAVVFQRLAGRCWGNTMLRFGIPFSGLVSHNKTCYAGERKLIVRYDGRVLPCEAFKDNRHSRFILGDIRTDTLIDILARGRSSSCIRELKHYASASDPCPAQLLHH